MIATVQAFDLPTPGSAGETNLVGAEMFFSSRGNFDAIPGTNSLRDRLSSEGWQSCASCHFKGLTDGVIWQFAAGPRKSVPLNSSFNPQNRTQQRLLNYSAIFDEIEDFERAEAPAHREALRHGGRCAVRHRSPAGGFVQESSSGVVRGQQ